MIDTNKLYWFTGLFEGEGCIATPKTYPFGLVIDSTDLDTLQKAHAAIGGLGSIVGPYMREERKPIYKWIANKQRDASSILMTVYPLLSERRREKATEALSIWRNWGVTK